MQKKVGKNPKELAQEIVDKIKEDKLIDKIEVAGAGFINFYLSPEFFAKNIEEILKAKDKWGGSGDLKNQKTIIEYTDPNPFKEFHIGHLMSNAIGESISRIVEFSGAEVKRANYQGDVGLHVAKAIFGKQKNPELEWGKAYAYGTQNYEDNEKEIKEINKKIYDKSDEEDKFAL